MKTYKVRSSAVRAAKKEAGENWADTFTIEVSGDEYCLIMTKKPAPEVTQLLADNDTEMKEKAAKAKKLKANKPIHQPATPISAPAQGQDHPESPKSSDPLMIGSGYSGTDGHIDPQKAGDALANQQAVNTNPLKPRVSVVDRPTKLVWDIADNMPDAKRKDVIAACVLKGIAYGTARTQYQHWFKQKAVSAAEPRASLDGNGKIVPPSK